MMHAHPHDHPHGGEEDRGAQAFAPTSEILLAAAADDIANAHIEIVQLKATVEMQIQIIEALKAQLAGES